MVNNIINGDNLEGMSAIQDSIFDTTFTSPPFNKKGLYGKKKDGNQIWKKHQIDYDVFGDDMDEEEYEKWQIKVLDEIYRVTKSGGSLFYHHKNRRFKNKCFTPFHFYEKSKWNLYQIIIIDRKNSPNIRNDILIPTTEYTFWLSKGKPRVYRNQLDKEFISEVWTIPPIKQKNHPAPAHPKLVENCINLTTKEGDSIFDPFMGIGTTAEVAKKMNRNWFGFEISQNYYRECVKKGLTHEKN